MIKLVLSTPRSGSTHYTETLRKTVGYNAEVIVLQEWMLKLFNDRYVLEHEEYTLSVDGYVDGSYYLKFNDDDTVNREYSKRRFDIETEFDIFCKFLETSKMDFLIHEHIHRLPVEWINRLISLSDEVHYITRNIKEQISSYAIAVYTGVYIYAAGRKYCLGDITHMTESDNERFEYSIVDPIIMNQFKDEVEASHVKAKELNLSIIKYEDLPTINSACQKKFPSSYDRLCDTDKQLIDKICSPL